MNRKDEREYMAWLRMKARCYAPSQNKGYCKEDGIKVCDEWLHDYPQFLKDMGRMPSDEYSLERIDVYKDYCPSNCKWIPKREQPINRRTTKFFTHNGEPLVDIAERTQWKK